MALSDEDDSRRHDTASSVGSIAAITKKLAQIQKLEDRLVSGEDRKEELDKAILDFVDT